MIRKCCTLALVVATVAAASAIAAPLSIGPAVRVSPSRIGTPGTDSAVRVEPRANGFAAYWVHQGELWSKEGHGFPPRPEETTGRDISAATFVAERGGEAMVAFYGANQTIRLGRADAPGTSIEIGQGTLTGLECNATHCILPFITSSGTTSRYAVTDGSTVQYVERQSVSAVTLADDPGGFLVFEHRPTATPRVVRVDNSGNITADVQLANTIVTAVAAFNGDGYAIFFDDNLNSISGRTMTLNGQLSATKTIYSKAPVLPAAAAWNGSEYLLVLSAMAGFVIPEATPQTTVLGAILDPSLSMAVPQPFTISQTTGANYASNAIWNGSLFYVSWTHTAAGLFREPQTSSVIGAAIAPNGDVLTRDLISRGVVAQMWPAPAQGATTSLAVWRESDYQFDTSTLKFALLARGSLNVITAGDIELSSDSLRPIDVVPLGDDYLVLWSGYQLASGGAAIVHRNGFVQKLTIPQFLTARATANADKWLIAATGLQSAFTIAIDHSNGIAAPPTTLGFQVEVGTVAGLASDGTNFFLTGTCGMLLDSDGKLVTRLNLGEWVYETDFAGGVYAALGANGTIVRFDRSGHKLGATTAAAFDQWTFAKLSHVGSNFVIIDDINGDTRLSIVAADGTLITKGEHLTRKLAVARTDDLVSTALETRQEAIAPYPAADVIYAEQISIANPRTRAVRR